MTSETVDNGQAVHAILLNAERKARRGYSVDSGCTVSINSGTLDAADTLSVASGSVWFGGQPVDVSQQDVQIDGGDPDPRKDVIYLDANGTVQVSKGSPAPVPADQQGTIRFATYRPTPPDLAATDAVILAEVWIAAGASSIAPADVADRRKFENRDAILASSSVTLSGGATPALDTRLNGVATDQLQDVTVVLTPDADPGWNADYAYNFDWSRAWDDSNSELDVVVQANWDTDPGSGNDLSATAYVIHTDL